MDEKKIVIVSDENGIVAFDDITIKHDTINRAEVEEVEKAIKSLEQEKITINDRIVELKAKLIYARKIIAIADEKRNSEISSNNANVTNESKVGNIISNFQTQRRGD
ncbi:MAG: hypothetical protein HFE32_03270 [Clostridia bacterium]|jgi:hypothetical protein|nr:hypothetical protein [Clostridia bacterium]